MKIKKLTNSLSSNDTIKVSKPLIKKNKLNPYRVGRGRGIK